MSVPSWRLGWALGLLPLAGPTGWAQDVTDPPAAAGPRFHGEVASDARVRGLSWSDGRPAATLGAWVPLGESLAASAAVTTLRGSARHGGAEGGVALGAAWSRDAGGWQLGLGATGQLFTGRSDLAFVELEGRAGYSLGPARLRGSLRYAPVQRAIGGSNLHLALDAEAGLPGTRWTLLGGVGHSSGAVRDPLLAARLRPGGAYWNWSLGAERIEGPLALGARWTGTSAGDAPLSPYSDRHTGSRLTGYLRLDF